jgi:hypothetical protein
MPFGFFIIIAIPAIVVATFFAKRRRRKAIEQALLREWGNSAPAPGSAQDPEALENVARYWRETPVSADGSAPVDDITWNDLDMDAVFQFLNKTQSVVGEDALYAMLRDINASAETLNKRKRWIKAAEENEADRLALQRRLRKLGREREHNVILFLSNPKNKMPAHAWAYYSLACMPLLFLALGFLQPVFFAGIAVSFFTNTIVFYRTRILWMREQTAVRHLAAVLNCAQHIKRLQVPEMQDAFEELGSLCARLKPIKRWNALYAMTPVNDFDFFTEYFRIAFQLDMISLTRLVTFIMRNTALVIHLYSLVGELDACVAIASVRASLSSYIVPEFVSEPRVFAENIAHPLLKNPVRNSIDWRENALITGSNASGKSTFVKALALNAIFAQSICTCWADRFSMPRAQVMSSMALRDDVQGGDSYFIVEIKSLKRILTALRDDRVTLCFIDEILRGTNTIERIASSTALLRYLESQKVLCLAATHDVELTQLLTPYRQYHFREDMTPQGMTFPYHLMDGACDTRNAIRLLEQMEFPSQVIASADELAAGFDKTGKWK